jgi:hypothetical protein
MKLIFSETSIIIPIGTNINNMAVKVAKYLLRMYLSNIVNIYKSLRLKFKNLKFKKATKS